MFVFFLCRRNNKPFSLVLSHLVQYVRDLIYFLLAYLKDNLLIYPNKHAKKCISTYTELLLLFDSRFLHRLFNPTKYLNRMANIGIP